MTRSLPEPTFIGDLDSFDLSRQSHADAARPGSEVRLARGAYLATDPWRELEALEQYLVRIRAVAHTRNHDMVISHWSAAAIHGLPIMGDWPERVHVTVGKVSGGRSRRSVIKHALKITDADIVEIDGMLVTSVARTIIDMAVSADQLTAVMAVDRALLIDRFGARPPMVTRDELWDCFDRRGNFWGSRRAGTVIDFGASAAESPLESASRLTMRIIRCPEPQLQVRVVDQFGTVWFTDFGWEEYETLGEAEGEQKYVDPQMLGHGTTASALIAEKQREDRIRDTGKKFTRWGWAIGVNPAALRLHLQRVGLPIP